jgi:ABC-2 type transport system ATP-binding protein
MLTGRENIRYFTRMLGYSNKDTKTIVSQLIDKVGLSEDADKRVSKYSGGMKKKLELATILYPGIKILILDEPTTGLDPVARRDFFGLIDELKEPSTTIFLITHLGSDAELGSKVGMIHKGKIIAEGQPSGLKRKHGSKSTIEVETSIKNDDIKKIIDSFNSGDEILDTEKGYKFYSDDPAEVLPKIMRNVEKSGYQVTHIGSTTPSLEDVFYKLTGKQVRGEDN